MRRPGSSPNVRRPKRWRRLRIAGAVVVIGLPLLLWSCFPAPIPELWPPRPGEPRHRIDVVYRDWHTIVVLPILPSGAPAEVGAEPAAHVHREYCERAWYLEGRQGAWGVLRSLLWPTASGIGEIRTAEPVWIRRPTEDLERWTFVLSANGLRALEEYYRSETGAPLPEFPGWHAGNHDYHLFHHCHHVTAGALRAAGLPIRAWWAFSASLLEIQLDRIARHHRDEGL